MECNGIRGKGAIASQEVAFMRIAYRSLSAFPDSVTLHPGYGFSLRAWFLDKQEEEVVFMCLFVGIGQS